MATPKSFIMTEVQAERFDFRIRVQAVDHTIERLVFAEGVLEQDSIGPKPSLGPETHYGYAVQWFLMALVLSAMMVYVFRKELG